MKELSEKEALYKATVICSSKEMSIFDIREKLIIWKVCKENTEHIINYLLKEKFIDENRFTKSFIHDKLHFNKWGKRKIYYELKNKMIPDNIIQETLNNVDKKEYFDILSHVIEQKKMTIRGKNEYEIQEKLIRFLLNRGFSMDDILTVLKTNSCK